MSAEELTGQTHMSQAAPPGERADIAIGARVLAAWEIASVTLSFLIAAWIVGPFAGNSKLVGAFSLVLALALMWLSHRARGETARDIGWRMDNFVEAVRLLVLPMLAVAALVALAGWFTGGFRYGSCKSGAGFLATVWGLISSTLAGFVNRRAQVIFGAGREASSSFAAVFAPSTCRTRG